MLAEAISSVSTQGGRAGRNSARRVRGRMNLLTVTVRVVAVVAELRARHFPACRVMEDNLSPAVIVRDGANDTEGSA